MEELSPSVNASDRTFDTVVIKSDLPVLVDFWAPWCNPCHAIDREVDELAKKYAGKIKFVKINVDEGQRTAMSLGVINIPTIMLFNRGKLVNSQVGIQPKDILNDMINRWLCENPN